MLRVLLVDDDHRLRLAMVEALRRADCDTVVANDGSDALDILGQDCQFDVIVSDIHMPRMDGIRFFETVKACFPHIAFIMTSGYSNHAWTIREIQKRSIRYLPKPFSRHQLVNAVYDAARLAITQ